MRILHGTLFVAGGPWALIMWMAAALPIGIFMPKYRYTGKDIAISLVCAALGS